MWVYNKYISEYFMTSDCIFLRLDPGIYKELASRQASDCCLRKQIILNVILI